PEPTQENPQKPKIDLQTLMENYELPLELRNFRIKEEAEKEKKLVIKGLTKHILEKKNTNFFASNSNTYEKINIKLEFSPLVFEDSPSQSRENMLTLKFNGTSTDLSLFSGYATGPYPSLTIGGKLGKEYGTNSFYLDFLQRKITNPNNPVDYHSISVFTRVEILHSLNISLDIKCVQFYLGENTFANLNPKISLVYHPSTSWFMKGEFSYSSMQSLSELEDYPFSLPVFSEVSLIKPFNLTDFSLSFYRFLFSDLGVGIKFTYKDSGEFNPYGQFLKKDDGTNFWDSKRAFQGALIISREKSSNIRFSVSPGILVPSIFPAPDNPQLTLPLLRQPFVFTFSSFLNGEIEPSGTHFEISYKWASYPYLLLTLKEIYSSRFFIEQKIPISKIFDGNLALVIEFRNFFNLLKSSISDHYLIILFPRWIRGGLEIQF
ncbi:MAG: hypothetical protein ACUVUG_06880, partial [Candidatus Aminicenantia bacterium]